MNDIIIIHVCSMTVTLSHNCRELEGLGLRGLVFSRIIPCMKLFSSAQRLAGHYTREGDRYLIEVRLADVRSLFNSLDPAPFIEKDLDADAEDYIVDTVQDFPSDTPLKLVIYLPADKLQSDTAATIQEAIGNYFDYRAQHTAMKLRFMLLQGRTSLIIGLLFLFGCLAARQLLGAVVEAGLARQIIDEGLLICGWVAMWRPIQIYLYDWWPIRRMRRCYEKIRTMPVELRAQQGR